MKICPINKSAYENNNFSIIVKLFLTYIQIFSNIYDYNLDFPEFIKFA